MSGWSGPALFRRLPKLCYHPASSPIAMLADCDEFPDLRDDLHFLAEVLQPQFEKCDIEALREQNRYRRQQLVLLAGGTIGAILGALQAAFDKVTWLGWLVVAITLFLVFFMRTTGRRHALQHYAEQRTRAERLRSLYFQYVTRVDRYTGQTRKERLRADVKDILARDLA